MQVVTNALCTLTLLLMSCSDGTQCVEKGELSYSGIMIMFSPTSYAIGTKKGCTYIVQLNKDDANLVSRYYLDSHDSRLVKPIYVTIDGRIYKYLDNGMPKLKIVASRFAVRGANVNESEYSYFRYRIFGNERILD